jgi:cellulose synthase/poly-beta-1,6-N-acetylglucosamine synthase-like glycosyltransferase
MTIQDIEIPYPQDRGFIYRIFEILPGFLTWSVLILPFILAFVSPLALTIIVIAYLIAWLIRGVVISLRVFQSYGRMRQYQKLDWNPLIADLDSPKSAIESFSGKAKPKWHLRNLELKLEATKDKLLSTDVVHAVLIPTYNESKEVLEETISSVTKTNFNLKQMVLILAVEERGGEQVVNNAKKLVEKYKEHFLYAICVVHPAQYEPGEIKGKASNANYAAYVLKDWLDKKQISYDKVLVTTLDADNRPDPNYFCELTYLYLMTPDRKTTSYQPISLYTNNIWDAPAFMRVLAIGNSFWTMIVSTRQHMLRNFSAHAQGMEALVDCEFWSKRTIVEDGHQYWRTLFRYDGKHEVFPVFSPIYQDAVLSDTYRKTLKAQFVQLRRWAWGASDIAYVIYTGFIKKNTVPKKELFIKTVRLIDSHLSWATAPLILAFASSIPSVINPEAKTVFVANQLPVIASYIQTIALSGVFVTLFISMKLLPPKPARYKSHRRLLLILQWALMPITSIIYNAAAAIYSQTRLMFGRYLGTFDVTDKAIKK